MATTQNEETMSAVAAADLSAAANKYKLVKLNTTEGQVALCSVLGERVDGVLGNNPGSGQPAEVIVEGQTKCKCGAAVATSNLELTTDATGRAIAAVSTNWVFALSLGPTSNADEFLPIKIVGPYIKA